MPPDAPVDAQYLTLAANGVLTDYRVLNVGNMLVAVDGGPGGTYDLNVEPANIDHGGLADLSANDHPQYMLGTILSADGDILTRVAGSPAALAVGSDGDVLTVSGGAPAWAAPSSGYQLLDSQPTEVVWNTTNTIQTLYTFSIPGSTLSSGALMRLRLMLDYLNNSGGSQTFILTVSLGGTTFYAGTSTGIAANANRRGLFLELDFAVRTQNPNVRMNGMLYLANAGAPTTGIGLLGTTVGQAGGIVGDANLTLSNALTLLVQWTHAASNANLEIRQRGATLELVNP